MYHVISMSSGGITQPVVIVIDPVVLAPGSNATMLFLSKSEIEDKILIDVVVVNSIMKEQSND